MPVRVVTDSTSDLPPELCRELGVTVVPLTVNFGDKEYRDGVDLSAEEFYQTLISSPSLPRTSQPSAGLFAKTYTDLAQEADEILSIHLSTKLSQTCNSAQLGAGEVEGRCRVEVVDSLQVSIGLGLVVVAAARAGAQDDGQNPVLVEICARSGCGVLRSGETQTDQAGQQNSLNRALWHVIPP